jgi:hypothetical protein
VGAFSGIAYSGGKLAQPADGIVMLSGSLLAIVVMRLITKDTKDHEGKPNLRVAVLRVP